MRVLLLLTPTFSPSSAFSFTFAFIVSEFCTFLEFSNAVTYIDIKSSAFSTLLNMLSQAPLFFPFKDNVFSAIAFPVVFVLKHLLILK